MLFLGFCAGRKLLHVVVPAEREGPIIGPETSTWGGNCHEHLTNCTNVVHGEKVEGTVTNTLARY